MGELVKFPGSGRPKQPNPVGQPTFSITSEGRAQMPNLIEIPSMSALYNTEQIMFAGRPISKLMRPHEDGIRKSTLQFLEMLLLNARQRFIAENIDDYEQRRAATRKLGEHTWLRGAEIDSTQLKDRVSDMLIHAFGLGQAGKMIERFSMIAQLPKEKQTPEDHEPDPTPPQILPFRRRE